MVMFVITFVERYIGNYVDIITILVHDGTF